MKALAEIEKDVSYSHSFVEHWLKLDPKTPAQILEHMKIIVDGLKYYREQYLNIQEDLTDQRERYAKLTAEAGRYLQHIQRLENLVEKIDENNLESAEPNISI